MFLKKTQKASIHDQSQNLIITIILLKNNFTFDISSNKSKMQQSLGLKNLDLKF